MKKKTLGLAVLISGGLVLSGCQNVTFPTGENVESEGTQTFALQATTAISMIGNVDTMTFSAMSDVVDSSEVIDDSEEVGETTQEADTPNIPVAALDILFTNGSDFNIEQLDSDREDYTNLDIISFSLMDEETISYSLYYNVETLEDNDQLPGEDIVEDDDEASSEEGEQPVSAPTLEHRHGNKEDDKEGNHHGHNYDEDEDEYDGHRHGQDNEDDDDHGCQDGEDDDHQGHGQQDQDCEHRHEHGKNEEKIVGLAIVGDQEYTFMSKTEIDSDSDEQEIESKFMLFKDQDNFISIKQENDIEGVEGEQDYEYEEEFKYSVVEDGQLTTHFKLEIEQEDGEQALEVKIDGIKYEVEYEVVDQRMFLHIDVKGVGEFTYEKIVNTDELTGEVSVEYILI